MPEAKAKKTEGAAEAEKKTAKKATKTATKTEKKTTKAKATKKTAKKTAKTTAKKTAKKTTKKTEKRLRVRQVKSGIRHPWRMRNTLTALGLKHHQDEVVVPDNPSIRGMIRRVHHLVSVTPEDTNG